MQKQQNKYHIEVGDCEGGQILPSYYSHSSISVAHGAKL